MSDEPVDDSVDITKPETSSKLPFNSIPSENQHGSMMIPVEEGNFFVGRFEYHP
jgi:hypothetical protein